MCLKQTPPCNVPWLQILFSGSFGHLLDWMKPEMYLNQSDFVCLWVLVLVCGFFFCLVVVVVVRKMVVFGWVRVNKTISQSGLPSPVK